MLTQGYAIFATCECGARTVTSGLGLEDRYPRLGPEDRYLEARAEYTTSPNTSNPRQARAFL